MSKKDKKIPVDIIGGANFEKAFSQRQTKHTGKVITYHYPVVVKGGKIVEEDQEMKEEISSKELHIVGFDQLKNQAESIKKANQAARKAIQKEKDGLYLLSWEILSTENIIETD